MKLISTHHTNLVSLEQFHHKSMVMFRGGLLDLALGGKGASSSPLEQCLSTPKKNYWANFCALSMYDIIRGEKFKNLRLMPLISNNKSNCFRNRYSITLLYGLMMPCS